MSLLFCLTTISFFLLFLNKVNNKDAIAVNCLNAFLLYALYIVCTTEILSVFSLLNRTSLIVVYIVTWSFLVWRINISNLSEIWQSIKRIIASNKLKFTIVVCIVIAILFQGLAYSPNNWDSMTYHLPRVIHWIQNQNVENYPTNITRQLYSPHLSEYTMLHFTLLSMNDIWVNSVQWIFYIGSAIAVYAIVKEWGGGIKLFFFTVILSLTIPEAILEASSTQNDIVHSFFLLACLFYGKRLFEKICIQNAIGFGLSVGLCLLSKIIAYLYLPAIGVVLLILLLVKLNKWLSIRNVSILSISLVLIISINLPFSLRKVAYSGTLSGTAGEIEKGIVFEKYSPMLLVSTAIKNVALHIDDLFVGNFANVFAEKSHLILGMDINEKGTNVFDYKYDAIHDWKNHEDSQPNFIHLLLFITAIAMFVVQTIQNKKIDKTQLFLMLIIILQFLSFCAYIRWEPWNSRVHTPLFYEMIIFIVMVFSTSKRIANLKYWSIPILGALILHTFYLITFNYSRPIITRKGLTSDIKISDSRFKKYFANNLIAYNEFERVHKKLLKKGQKFLIGYISHIDGWEYPIIQTHLENNNVEVHHVFVKNKTKKYEHNRKYDLLLSSFAKFDSINLNSLKYIRYPLENKYLQCFKRIN